MFWVIHGFAWVFAPSKNENTVKHSQHQNHMDCNLIFNFVVVVILEDSSVYFKAMFLQEWSGENLSYRHHLIEALVKKKKKHSSNLPGILCQLKITG